MTETKPLHDVLRDAGAEFMPYGPGEGNGENEGADGGPEAVEIAAAFGQYEAEYAAIRRHVAVLHLPQRGLLRVTGDDRQDFLHRLMTQDIASMKGGDSRRSFQLNNKGRIVADAVVHHGDLDTWIELDRWDATPTRELLDQRLFSEEVVFETMSDQREVVAVMGPAALTLVDRITDAADTAVGATDKDADDLPLADGTHHVRSIAGRPVTVCRRQEAGELALRLFIETAHAAEVYQKLLAAAGYDADADADPDATFGAQRRQSLRGRPIGWQAYNTARIEAGDPLFHIDFGHDSLPAEVGPTLLEQAVCFTAGCYLGQEIVARMNSLGHPKRVLVGLRLDTEQLPVAGGQVFDADNPAAVVGGITSSTLSPLRGNQAIAFAVIKWAKHHPGTPVALAAEGRRVAAEVRGLSFMQGE